jgi:uncharacterized protein YlxP (DUF503 family)
VDLGMMLLELALHAVLDLVRIVHAHRHHPKRVGDERQCEVVVLDFRELAEQHALVRIVEMRLEREHSLALQRFDQDEHESEQISIVVSRPFRAGEDVLEIDQRTLHHVRVVGDQEGSGRGTADHHQLERQRLDDDRELAAGEQIAAEHHDEDHDDPDDREHPRAPRPSRPNP